MTGLSAGHGENVLQWLPRVRGTLFLVCSPCSLLPVAITALPTRLGGWTRHRSATARYGAGRLPTAGAALPKRNGSAVLSKLAGHALSAPAAGRYTCASIQEKGPTGAPCLTAANPLHRNPTCNTISGATPKSAEPDPCPARLQTATGAFGRSITARSTCGRIPEKSPSFVHSTAATSVSAHWAT